MCRVGESVDEAANAVFGTTKAEQTCLHDARSVDAARDGIGQPTRIAVSRRTAVRFRGPYYAFAPAQLAKRAAAFVHVRRIDH